MTFTYAYLQCLWHSASVAITPSRYSAWPACRKCSLSYTIYTSEDLILTLTFEHVLIWPVISTPPPAKRPRTASSGISSSPKPVEILQPPPPPVPIEPRSILNTIPPPVVSPPNPRKRPLSKSPAVEQRPPLNLKPPPSNIPIAESSSAASVSIPALLSADSSERPRKARTNTPWTAAEEQRLKQMRDTGNTWSEIAKVSVHFSHRLQAD